LASVTPGGGLRWTTPLNPAEYSRPVLVGDTVFLTSSEDGLLAFDARRGEFLARVDTGSGMSSVPSYDPEQARLYAIGNRGDLFAFWLPEAIAAKARSERLEQDAQFSRAPESVPEPASEPAQEPVPEPVPEPVAEPAVEAAPEPARDPALTPESGAHEGDDPELESAGPVEPDAAASDAPDTDGGAEDQSEPEDAEPDSSSAAESDPDSAAGLPPA